jgi:gliding motility-associated-like protein
MSATKLLPKSLWIVLLAILSTGTYTSAQLCTPTFHKTYNGIGHDEAYDIMVTTDGGSIVAGRTTSNSSAWDGFLLRLNTQGDIVWSKTYGGSQYDDLSKVRQTTDGGYIAFGKTSSFGVDGAAYLVKTNGDGDLLWSKRLYITGQKVKPKYIIELKGGGFLLALNSNDSTVQGNGIIIRTDGVGNTIWSKVFDHGNDDGFNHLYQDGNTILIGGFATVNDREGVLMRMDLNNGSVLWAKKFARRVGLSDEIVEVEKTATGLAFGASSTWIKSDHGYNPYFLTLFKTIGDDSIEYKRRVDITTGSGTVIESLNMRSTSDGGFIYAASDTTPLGWPSFRKISPAGLADWGREVNGYAEKRLYGLDLYGTRGYVLAGFIRSSYPTNRNQIQVLKTDIAGKTGTCTGNISANFTDTTFYQISPFTWGSITDGAADVSSITPSTSVLDLTTNILCSDTYCDAPDQTNNDPCAATILTHLSGIYTFQPYDMAKVDDGYLLFGYNRIHWNVEPMIIKMRGDGTVAWSKAMASYLGEQGFDQVIPSDDGNFLITGKSSVTIDHGVYSGDLVLKINSNGDVLWSKSVTGDIYDIHADKQGGFVGTITTNYGFPPIYITLFRMDANGNFTWQKQLNKDYDNHPIFRRIVYDGSNIYAAGEFYNQFPQNIAIEKFDLSGNRLWSKRFTVNGFPTAVESLDMIGDSLYLMAYYFDNSQNQYMSKGRFAAVKIGKNGEGMNGFSLNNLDLAADGNRSGFLSPRQQRVTKTFDDNFVAADRASASSDSSIVLTKFTPSGKILWSVRYDNLKNHFVARVRDDNGGLLVLGRKYRGLIDYTPWYETLFMRTDTNGKVTTNGSGFCRTIPSTIETKPISFTYLTFIPNISAKDGTVATKSYKVNAQRSFVINSTISCKLDGNCSPISINGQTAICNSADTITYLFKRNEGCTSAGYWKYDIANIKIIKQTDTSISVKFQSAGLYKISAFLIAGCGVIADTIDVTVPFSGNMLTLGADTTMCEGTAIVLNAKKGYTSYIWQDGSTDSTFIVTRPGTYRVTVTDACNQIYSDETTVIAQPPIAFDMGPDRTKCDNDTLQLNAPSGFMNYSWTPSYNITPLSTQKVVVRPTVDTFYAVKAEKTLGCFAYDTVRVTVYKAPSIQLGSDLSFCSGDSSILNASSGFNSYLWSTGDNLQQITVSAVGQYTVTGTTDKGCKSRDTLVVKNVWALPLVNLGKNSELCLGSSRTLSAGNYLSYLWHDGSTSRTHIAKDIGRYFVQVTDVHGCVGSDTTEIKTMLPLPTNFLPQDTVICSYGEVLLKPRQNYNSYLWSDGSRSQSIVVNKPGLYWLQVEDGKHCVGRDTMMVGLKECMNGVYVATAFTPNRDGKNDLFKALVFGPIQKYELTVYNRWGQVVFKTSDSKKGWDGKVNGLDVQTDVYIWTCIYQLQGSEPMAEKGTVTLIR